MTEIEALNRACDALSFAGGLCRDSAGEFRETRAALLKIVERHLLPVAPSVAALVEQIAEWCLMARRDDIGMFALKRLISSHLSARVAEEVEACLRLLVEFRRKYVWTHVDDRTEPVQPASCCDAFLDDVLGKLAAAIRGRKP